MSHYFFGCFMRRLLSKRLRLISSGQFVHRRVLELVALAAGGVAGFTGALFQLSTERILVEKNHLANHLASENFASWMWVGIISSFMLVLSLWLVRRFSPEDAGSILFLW